MSQKLHPVKILKRYPREEGNMVLENKQTTVAYRCPHCGTGVMSVVNIFNLKADMVKLKCTCGESEMTVTCSKDGKVRFNVPCVLCPNPHNFTVSSSIFFGKDLFVLPCPYSDINVCMMGDVNHVKAELSRSELELLDLLEKSGLDSFEAFHSEQFLSDPQVTEIVTYVIKELDEEGRISCKCCGASKFIPTDSLIRANDFLNADSLELE